MYKKLPLLLFLVGMAVSCSGNKTQAEEPLRPRTIITTDGECDDIDSFVRVLLYANDLDIQGIVYSSSMWHWKGDGKGTLLLPENRAKREGPANPFMREPVPQESNRWIGETWVQELIDKYGECLPNLLKHDSRYPSAEYLKSIVKMGNVRVEGDMTQPTEGSDFIRDLLLDDVPGPLYAQIWGGSNTVARALLSIEEQYKGMAEWENVHKKVSDKLVLNIIQDQDGTYRTYIADAWPGVRVVCNASQFGCFAYMWRQTVPQQYLSLLDGDWFKENILEGHGPLMAEYLTLGSGYDINDPADRYGDPEMVNRMPGAKMNDFISEGDSPSYFVLFDFLGLRSLDHPDWGSAGGRYVLQEGTNLWRNTERPGGFRPSFGPRGANPEPERPKELFNRASGDFNPASGEVDMFYPQTRWVEVLQNDFAARADWCVKDYADANHMPQVSVKGALDITAKAGEKVVLKASALDPDGDDVALSWWQYREAGTSDAVLDIKGAGTASASFAVPADALPGSTFHVILQGTDNGTPSLTHFQRVIVTIR